jgi:hypothetical protein
MKKLSGWQKAGLIAGVGCFSILGVIVIGIIVAVVWARSTLAELGDTTPTKVERSVGLGTPQAEAPDATAERVPGAASDPRQPMHLTVDLEEGTFTVRPGPPGGQVQIQGTYATNLYELTERHDTDTSGNPRATIRFRSKAPVWARILSGFGDNAGGRPQLTVIIPQGSPMDLSLRIGMGESRIDLGGLTLRELDLALSMGEHRLDFAQPLIEGPRRVRLDASMGDVRVENLGNTRAQSVEMTGSMGSLTADLGGAWEPGGDAALSFTQSMGELTLRVPSGVRLETDFRNSEGQSTSPPAEATTAPSDPAAPLLKLRVQSSMGESRVVRY